jgi:parallel beta-helix repeat protein
LTGSLRYGIWTQDDYPVIAENVLFYCLIRVDAADGGQISGNVVTNAGIIISESSEVRVQDNVVDQAPAVGIVAFAQPARLVVTNNTVRRCGGAGIYLANAPFSVVSSNLCVDNGRVGGVAGGIQLWETTHALIADNVCTDSQPVGSKTQYYGVVAYSGGAGCNFNTFTGNELSGNRGPSLSRSGANDVLANNRI